MGFKDAEWVQDLELPLVQKAVLIVLALATNDKHADHRTIIGQETIAQRSGASIKSVSRALGDLERAGIIARSKRHRANGARSSDEITLNHTYRTESPQGAEPTRQSAYKADSPNLSDSLSKPIGLSDGGNGINQIDQPVDQPDLMLIEPETSVAITDATFDDFWKAWPRSEGRKVAEAAWNRAIKRAPAALILDRAIAYATHPHRTARQFVPYASSWLNQDRWEDPPPQAPEGQQRAPTPSQRLLATLALADNPKALSS